MEVCTKFVSFIFVTLTLITLSTQADDTCVMRKSCVCVYPNGTGINLNEATRQEPYTAQIYNVKYEKDNATQYEMTTFFYHPCFDIKLNIDFKKANTSCNNYLSLCRHVSTMNMTINGSYAVVGDIYDYLGTSNTTKFSTDGISIIYENGPSSTAVVLTCAETDGDLKVFDIVSDPSKLVLRFYSRHACLIQIDEPGRSVGSTLCIIFFSFLIFYLVLGICTKKFLMGATGIEVVPNLAFWTDLPNLVKDGWAFTISGFRLPVRGSGPVTSPDPNSYDSI